jgi:hypothetical protein
MAMGLVTLMPLLSFSTIKAYILFYFKNRNTRLAHEDRITILSVMTLGKTTLNIKTLSILTLSMMTVSI